LLLWLQFPFDFVPFCAHFAAISVQFRAPFWLFRESGKPVGDALSGIAMGLGAGGCAHGGEVSGVSQQRGERFEKASGHREIGLFKHDSGAGLDHGLRIAFLMLVCGGGERDKQAGLSGGG
jgi:hypothetical protein